MLMLKRFFLRVCLCSFRFASMKENTINAKADAGRIGGLAKVSKGFAINATAHVKAIRASARTRKKKAIEKRKLIEGLVNGGTLK